MPWLAAPPTKYRKSEKSRHNAWDILSIFFFKNRIKNPHWFFKGSRKNRAITRRAFITRGLKYGGVTRFVKKAEKIRKSSDFRDISKIIGMNVCRPDTYPEKNLRDFRTVIFGAKIFFTENQYFSIFAKKWIKNSCLWKRRVIVQKRKKSQIFLF